MRFIFDTNWFISYPYWCINWNAGIWNSSLIVASLKYLEEHLFYSNNFVQTINNLKAFWLASTKKEVAKEGQQESL